ncbi:acyl carrier protein [Sorangium sp. So ce302]|uniref:acyl carrier protein n=1 Tax=unclassified Sorangium TaxID=2621164 RepID=UPI003F5E5046
MEGDDILAQLTRIIAGILDADSLELREETVARDVPGWDSLSNVQIVLAIEKHFRVRFTTREIRGLENVGAICALLRARREGQAR